jgi:hypothetical protein
MKALVLEDESLIALALAFELETGPRRSREMPRRHSRCLLLSALIWRLSI